MKKLIMAAIACGFVLSAMTVAAAQQGQAMNDAKNAQKDPNAVFDGRKTTIKHEVKAGTVTQQDPKAISAKLNKDAAKGQKGANIDGAKHAPPSPVVTKPAAKPVATKPAAKPVANTTPPKK